MEVTKPNIIIVIHPQHQVAVKFEKESSRCPQLRHEYKVYRELVNCHGFCCVSQPILSPLLSLFFPLTSPSRLEICVIHSVTCVVQCAVV